MSDGEHSESLSSLPDTEPVESGVISDKDQGDTAVTSKLTMVTPPGPASLSPPHPPPAGHRSKSRPAPPPSLSPMTPISSNKPLTSLANLSPTPKTMLTGIY